MWLLVWRRGDVVPVAKGMCCNALKKAQRKIVDKLLPERVDALLALKRYEEADRVLDEQLLATPDAPELLHARAMLVYIRQGGEAARTWLSDEVPDLEEDPIHAKSYDLHSCIGCMLSLSEKAAGGGPSVVGHAPLHPHE